MQSRTGQRLARHVLRTVLYLIGVSAVVTLILGAGLSLTGIPRLGNPLYLFIVLMAGSMAGGSLWARSVIKSVAHIKAWRPALISGTTFGLMVFVSGYSLELIEQELFRRDLLNAPGVHLQFLALFGAAIASVVGLTGFVMTLPVAGLGQATRIGGLAVVVSLAAFISIDSVMSALGWRVGHIDFPDRPTMTTVTAVALLASALTAGTSIGVLVERACSRRVANQP